MAPDLSAGLPVLAGAQALVLLGLAPGWATRLRGTERLAAAALTIMLPWPVLVLVFATGSASVPELAMTESAVALWALTLGMVHGLVRRLPGPWHTLCAGAIQGISLAILLRVMLHDPDLGSRLIPIAGTLAS
jgi:hypothetical protein